MACKPHVHRKITNGPEDTFSDPFWCVNTQKMHGSRMVSHSCFFAGPIDEWTRENVQQWLSGQWEWTLFKEEMWKFTNGLALAGLSKKDLKARVRDPALAASVYAAVRRQKKLSKAATPAAAVQGEPI